MLLNKMAPRLQERLAAKELAEIQAAIIASTNDAANTSSVVSTTPADVSGVTDILSLPTAGSDIPQTEINYNDHQSLSETTPQNMAGAMENVSEDTEMTTENSVEATTESMSSMEQSITQTRRTNPKRQAALKAVGRYAMEEMVTSVDEVSTQMSLSTFSRKSSKRTRTEAFGDAENTLEDQTFTAPDMINEGKTTTMVMRDRTLPNYGRSLINIILYLG